ncbi:hypothetical protein HDZ31DRAFT_61279 [Schizophyllum fasciatum]
MPPVNHDKTRLHNFVAGRDWEQPTYEYVPFGRADAPMWLCIVRLRGGEIGRGDAPKKNVATDIAAKRALDFLRGMDP